MNKKGFTLVELLGVVAIFALSLLIIIPKVIGVFEATDRNKLDELLNDIYIATDTYLNNNKDKYPELQSTGTTVEVSFSNLSDDLLIEKNLINPTTNQPFSEKCRVEVYVGSDYSYSYDYACW